MDSPAALLDKFAQAEAIWYASVRPDGRPHLAPIWCVWHDDAAWVVTQSDAVRARNLAANSSVSLSLADPMNALIIEGVAEDASNCAAAVRELFQTKYDWDISTDNDYQFIIRVRPIKLMAWGNHGEGRWRYEDGRWHSLPK